MRSEARFNRKARFKVTPLAAQASRSISVPFGNEESPKSPVGAPPDLVTPAALRTELSTLFIPETEPSPALPS